MLRTTKGLALYGKWLHIFGQVSGTSSLAASLSLETGEPGSTALELLEFVESLLATLSTRESMYPS